MPTPNKMTGNFSNKPNTTTFFTCITQYLESLGPSVKEVKAQVSFAVNRKFIWLWTYDKTPDGILYMTVCLDKKLNDNHFHYVKQVSKNRWNHHVEVKSEQTATSSWLRHLIREGYEFAKK